GVGIGRVTKPGLDQPVGEAAINHVPREMILKEVEEVCTLLDYREGLNIVISCPEGEEIAKNTFNPRLGIVGGISILGTSGIVEPMSSQALLDTIYVELKQKRALGYNCVAISPGNYGLDFMKEAYGYDLDRSVKCSNFIGDTIDMAIELGYSKLLLTGHIGKLVKVAGGMMNTHSKMGDCRMELLTSAAIQCGCSLECAKAILNEVNTEQGIVPIQKEGKVKETMSFLLEKMMFFLEKRACGKLEIGVILYSNVFKELARSNNAISLLEECRG
ncbi:MAG: cobalamin biosynthesis protein CbiD, partial [Firmicutes bacterium]|nr:cobalamin biosynthesis protein CbiD [Bacillota bacterium]